MATTAAITGACRNDRHASASRHSSQHCHPTNDDLFKFRTSQQKDEKRAVGQPGATLRDVSVGNWLLWPQAGPIQDHLNWVKIHRDDLRRRPTPLILWAAWGSNPEPKDSGTGVVVVRG
jgi:hypothetical protein